MNNEFAAKLAAMENRRNVFLDDTSSFLDDLENSTQQRKARLHAPPHRRTRRGLEFLLSLVTLNVMEGPSMLT